LAAIKGNDFSQVGYHPPPGLSVLQGAFIVEVLRDQGEDTRLAFAANEIAELRHRDASRRDGRPFDRVNAAIHGLGTGQVQANVIRCEWARLGLEPTKTGNSVNVRPYLFSISRSPLPRFGS
jgi:hypothetical protein